MKFNDYDVVRLTVNFDIVPAGSKGTILMSFSFPSSVYMVEFIDEFGDSMGTFEIKENDLELVWKFKK